MDALTFLDKPPVKRQPIYALFGDEDFLKRRCRDAAIKLALGEEADPEFAVASYQGDKLDFSTVRNELETLPFLAPARVVVVEPADAFVTDNRDSLEKYAAAPSKVGVLILDLKSFPETTRLAKALPDAAKLSCKAPSPAALSSWCVKWAKAGHEKKLNYDAAEQLLELVGPSMGQLDQELEKLAAAVGAKADITADDVDRLVGRSRAANVFHILDAIGDGKPADALNILAQLLDAGDDPMKVLGALTHQLRKLATVGRLLNQGLTLFPAMDEAGIGKWPQARQGAERQVKHLGRARLNQLPDWLVDINGGLKGGNPLPPRVQLERLVARLAAPNSSSARPPRPG